MLYYQGWIFEGVGKKISMPTKIFMTILKFVNKYASFFSFSDLMPWLFVPSLDATIKKYLRSVRPLLDDEKYDEMVKLSEEFKDTIGRGLQRKLWMKWLTSKNYVSDWWKEVVYMRYRNSLLNTNVGCADVIFQKTTSIQAARAANVVYLRLQFIREVYQKQSMKPITLGLIPLCPSQYIDYYRSLRVPRETSDEMIRIPETKHIAVYSKGCWYKLNVFHGRRLLRPAELERSIQAIVDRTPDPIDHEPMISALTCGPRDLWARIRKEKFGKGVNSESLSFIETALDVVFLDDEESEYDEDDPRKYDDEVARALHGNGYLLWCDKPSVYLISKNGRMASNGEHSVVDAMIYVHIREYTKYHEQYTHTYTPDGHCRGEIEVVPTAERLKWNLDDETKAAIDEAYAFGKNVADDFENACVVFKDFGKDFMKTIKVSPDAFIQMAIQMAYYINDPALGNWPNKP
uniref:Choline/carnitine acyltransferase domain-containing protein n=1 Tax=Acrobeloides nanus TaxID=290746 RepID=A0A914EA57_9BILA